MAEELEKPDFTSKETEPEPAPTLEVVEVPEPEPVSVVSEEQREKWEKWGGKQYAEAMTKTAERAPEGRTKEAYKAIREAGGDVTLTEVRKMSPDQRAAALGIGGAGWTEEDLAYAIAHPKEPSVQKEIARIRAEETPVLKVVTPPSELTAETPPDVPGGQVATVKGKEYYIPGSTMYKMGYSIPEEYTGAARPVEAAPYTYVEGKLLPKEELAIISGLTGKARFERQIEAGIIPEGSVYVSEEARQKAIGALERYKYFDVGKGYDVYDSIALATALSKGKIKIEDLRMTFGTTEEGRLFVVDIQSAAAEIPVQKRSLAQLKDYIDPVTEELHLVGTVEAEVPPSVIRLAGYDVSNKDYEVVKRQIDALTTLEPYRVISPFEFGKTQIPLLPDQPPYEPKTDYDIIRFLADNPNKENVLLNLGYNQKEVDKLQVAASIIEYKLSDTEWDVVSAIDDDFPESKLKLLFGDKEIEDVKEVMRKREGIEGLVSLFSGTAFNAWGLRDRDDLFKNPQTGEVLTAEETKEHWKWFESEKARLQSEGKWDIANPEYKAFMRKQKETIAVNPEPLKEAAATFGVDAGMLVLTLGIPWTYPAVGAIGTRVVTGLVRPVVAVTSKLLKPVSLIPRIGPLVATLTPRITGAVFSMVPKMATSLAQVTTLMPAVHTTAKLADEFTLTSNLDRKWDAFKLLTPEDKDKYARQSGYEKFEGLDEAEQANVLLHYTPPTGFTLTEWSNFLMENTQKMTENAEKGVGWLQERAPAPLAAPIGLLAVGPAVAVGIMEGFGYMANLPIILTNMVDKVPRGTAKEFADEVVTGMWTFMKSIPSIAKASPYGAGRMVGLLFLTPLAFAKFTKGFGYDVPKSVVKGLRGIALQYDFSVLKPWKVIPKAKMIEMTNKLVTQMMTKGLKAAKVRYEGVDISVRTTSWQEVIGQTLFVGTTNLKGRFGENVIFHPTLESVKGIATAPQFVERFTEVSARGVRAKAGEAGIAQLVVPKDYQPVAVKILKRGAELESWVQEPWYPVPGSLGKTTYRSPYTGKVYPVQVYTLGKAEWKGISLAQRAKLIELGAKNALIDALVGWQGRMDALNAKFKKDRIIANTEKGIKTLKEARPEIVELLPNGEHRVVRQRSSVTHPVKGDMHPRITGLLEVFDPKTGKTGALFVMDKVANTWGSVGGRLELGWKRYRPKEGHTWESGLKNQSDSELNTVPTNIEYVGLYRGKVNAHALSGSRVLRGVIDATKVDPKAANRRLIREGDYPAGHPVEIKDWMIWWGDKLVKTPVDPAFYDILKVDASKHGWDMSKIKIDTSNASLLRARDTKFGVRRPDPTPFELNKLDIKWLRQYKRGRYYELNAPARLIDYITAEPDMRFVRDILKGQRRVVTTKEAKMSLAEAKEQLWEFADFFAGKEEGRILLKKLQEGKLTEADTGTLNKMLRELVSSERARLQKVVDTKTEAAYDFIYKYGAETYRQSFANYLYAASSKAMRYAPAKAVYPGYLEVFAPAYKKPVVAKKEAEYITPVVAEKEAEYITPAIVEPKYPEPVTAVYEVPPPPPTYEVPPPPAVYEVPPPPRYEVPPPPVVYEVPPPPAVYEVVPPPPPKYEPVPPPPPKYDVVPPPVKVPVPPPLLIPLLEEAEEVERKEIPLGSIAWRQGELRGGSVWRYIPPPFTQKKPRTLIGIPIGAVRTHLKTPRETLQVVGKAPEVIVPKDVHIDLGVTDIYITEGGKNIRFEGKGLESDIGLEIEGPEKGMSTYGLKEVKPEAPGPIRPVYPLPRKMREFEDRELGIEPERVPKRFPKDKSIHLLGERPIELTPMIIRIL